MNDKPLKVAINATLMPDGQWGGVEQFIMSLVHGLGRLEDGDEEYIIIGPQKNPFWLKPFLRPNQRILPVNSTNRGPSDLVKRALGPFRGPAAALLGNIRKGMRRSFRVHHPPAVPVSSGFYESLGADVLHFPSQSFVHSQLPSIYNPHDLQHLHYPQFFTRERIAHREILYRAGCRSARAVAVESRWVKEDIVARYGIEPDKIHVIPFGSPTDLYDSVTEEALAEVKIKHALPETFALYPAQTWPHKNHKGLLSAIELLRSREGLVVNLVCTGRKNDFWPSIEKHIDELNLADQVRFLGFVSPAELHALYRLSQFVVVASMFEGGGLPVLEAFRERTPVTCSNVTSLPEYAGDAALLFDPTSTESMAGAIRRMAGDAQLREKLRERGADQMRFFNWTHAARMYRALYRKTAGRDLSSKDLKVLEFNLTKSQPFEIESV